MRSILSRGAALGALCALVAAPSALAGPFGGELLLSGHSDPESATEWAGFPDAAYNRVSDNYLVAYEGGLSAFEPAAALAPGDGVFVQLLNHDGQRTGAEVPIAPNAAAFLHPVTVTADTRSGGWLVNWYDNTHVYGQLVAADGTPVGEPILVGEDDYESIDPPHAVYNHDTDEFVVAWKADRASDESIAQVFVQRVSAAGDKVGVEEAAIRSETGWADRGGVHIAYSRERGRYLVAWVGTDAALAEGDEDTEVYGQFLDRDGAPVGGNVRMTELGDANDGQWASAPRIAYNGRHDQWLAAFTARYESEPETFTQQIFVQPLAGDGTTVGEEQAVSSSRGGTGGGRPDVVYDPGTDRYLVTWHVLGETQGDTFAQLLDGSGQQIGDDEQLSTGGGGVAAIRPRLTLDTRRCRFLAAWISQGDSPELEIRGRLYDNGPCIYPQKPAPAPQRPTPQAPAPDRTKASCPMTLSVTKSRRTVRLRATCNEATRGAATFRFTVDPKKGRTKTYTVRTKSRAFPARKAASVSAGVPRAVRNALGKARVSVRATLAVKDAAGNASTRRASMRLRK